MRVRGSERAAELTILMISSGDSVLRSPIANERDRHARYAMAAGCLHMIVYSPRHRGLRSEQIARNLVVHPTRSLSRLLFPLDAYRMGVRLCAREPVDLVTTQDPFDTGLAGALLSRRFGLPLEIQNHSNFYADLAWGARSPRFRILKQLGLLTLRRAALLRVLNRAEADAYRRLGLRADRIRILPTPVDVSGFGSQFQDSVRLGMRKELGLDAEDLVVVWVGRMAPVKNLPLWLRTAQIVAGLVPKARFLLVGDGQERVTVTSMIDRLGLTDRVVLTGALPHGDLATIYRACDIYLHTSEVEGFGKVLVEAQASGLPVVTTDAYGPRMIIEDRVTGYVCQADADELAGRVVELLADTSLRARLGQRAERAAAVRFNYDRMVDAIVYSWRAMVQEGVSR